MRNNKFLPALLGFLLACGLFIAQTVYAQGEPVIVQITPPSAQIGVGQTVDLAIEVVGVQDMFALDAEVRFDPRAVEVVDADPENIGVQVSLGTFIDPGFVIINQADNNTGSLKIAMTQLAPSNPKSGTGNLVVIRFKGKQPGDAIEIQLASIKIAREDGAKIPTTPRSGRLHVLENNPAPTFTYVPTQGAGTSMPVQPTQIIVDPTATQRLPVPQPTTINIQPTNRPAQPSPNTATLPPATATNPAPTATFTQLTPSVTADTPATATNPAPSQPQIIEPASTSETSASDWTPTRTLPSENFTPTSTRRAVSLLSTAQNQDPTARKSPSGLLIVSSALGIGAVFGITILLLSLAAIIVFYKQRRSN